MTEQAAGAEAEVLIDVRGSLGHITLNRPRAINALNANMVDQVARVLEEWASDDRIATVLLTGAGERGLCAGGDIVSIYRDAEGNGSESGGTASEEFWRNEYQMNAQIHRYAKPFVAVMHGIVLGGGIGIAGHASHRIVNESSSLGMPETGIGLVPDVGGTWLLSHSPGELGTHLALTAGSVGAGDAIELGLADWFIPAASLPDFFRALETSQADAAVARYAVAAPASALAADADWIDVAYQTDDFATILARLSALPDEGAARALESLGRRSPTALKATLAALRRARKLPSLEATLEQDLRLVLRFLKEPDLAEGIRAQVIDKDRNPKWQPPTVGQVDDQHIESLFASLGERELRLTPNPM